MNRTPHAKSSTIPGLVPDEALRFGYDPERENGAPRRSEAKECQ